MELIKFELNEFGYFENDKKLFGFTTDKFFNLIEQQIEKYQYEENLESPYYLKSVSIKSVLPNNLVIFEFPYLIRLYKLNSLSGRIEVMTLEKNELFLLGEFQ